ncbi:MAG: group II truncated hemoglobin [Acidimicrobiales bacterium]
MSSPTNVPTLFDWAGGLPAFEKLTALFYAKVPHDSLLAPLFGDISPEHANRVAHFIAEVFGGPPLYTQERGGHATMIHEHLDRHLTEAQRRRFCDLLCESADEAGLPSDAEFRSAFVAYLEWGTRIAVTTSQLGGDESAETPMPKWGWGVPGGPYQP